jgi:hypothetical protein
LAEPDAPSVRAMSRATEGFSARTAIVIELERIVVKHTIVRNEKRANETIFEFLIDDFDGSDLSDCS